MKIQIPMEMTLTVYERQGADSRRSSHFASVVMGGWHASPSRNDTEERFRCSVSGRSVFACLDALRKMAREWAKQNRVFIEGLNDNKSCLLSFQNGDIEITVVPVTYNEWMTERHL